MSPFGPFIPTAKAVSIIGGLDTTKIFAANGLIGVVTNIFNLVSWASGIVSVVFVAVGGVMYIVSAGNPSLRARSQKTIIYAIVGMVISIAAIAITSFIITSLGGSVSS